MKMALNLRLPKIRIAAREAEAPYSPVTTYYMILVPAALLAVFGLVMTFSATTVQNIAQQLNPYLAFARNFTIILVSVGVTVIAALLRPSFWQRIAGWMFLGAVILQSLVMSPLGAAQGGNQNWVTIPVINQTIQPSEFLKLATALVFAKILTNLGKRVENIKDVLPAILIPTVASVGAVLLGHDMGTALIFVAIIVGALWVAGVPFRWFPLLGLVVVAGASFLVATSPSRARRVLDMVPGIGAVPDPSAPTQSAQGLWALGAGGLFGLGPGASRAKWNYLQEAETDFILAIVGEEFGLIGTLLLVVLMGVLVWGILRLSIHSPNSFVRIASGGIAAWFLSQSFVNIGTVVGLTPVIGVPFPLVSYGGSAFLFTAMAIGVLLSFAATEAGFRDRRGERSHVGRKDPRREPEARRVARRSAR